VSFLIQACDNNLFFKPWETTKNLKLEGLLLTVCVCPEYGLSAHFSQAAIEKIVLTPLLMHGLFEPRHSLKRRVRQNSTVFGLSKSARTSGVWARQVQHWEVLISLPRESDRREKSVENYYACVANVCDCWPPANWNTQKCRPRAADKRKWQKSTAKVKRRRLLTK